MRPASISALISSFQILVHTQSCPYQQTTSIRGNPSILTSILLQSVVTAVLPSHSVWKWCWKARVHPRTRLQLMLVITSCQSHLISGMNSTISTARGRKREGKHNSFYWHLLHIFVVITCSYSPHTRLYPGPNCPFLLVPFLAQIV